MNSNELPVQRQAGVEYRSCEWCGEAVSQLGSRSPRLYCKRSHRQRAFEARRLGQPMQRDRGKETSAAQAPAVDVVVPDPPAAPPPAPLPKFPSLPARMVPPGPRPGRRSLLPPPPGKRRPEPTLFDEE